MEKRITKKENLMSLRGLAIENGRQDLVDFCDHEIDLLNRKSASKTQTARQVENETLKEIIINILDNTDKAITISELQASNENLTEYNGNAISNQRITNLLTQLIKSGDVVRTEVKGKAYFSKNN